MADVTFDLDAIQAEVGQMTDEDVRKALMDIKVRQKVATKKYYNPETAKQTRLKAAAKQKALIALAKEKGFYDQINVEAGKIADQKLAEEAVTEDND